MREITSITVFTGKDAFPLDLEGYTKVIEVCLGHESSVSMSIDFYKGADVVRRLWNPSCDIRYKTEKDPCPSCAESIDGKPGNGACAHCIEERAGRS